MTISNATRKKQRLYNLETRRAGNIGGLSKIQFKYLLKSFYEFARNHGFYNTRREAKDNNGFFLFQWQVEICEAILRSLFMKIDTDITISILRQVGKTEAVGLVTAFAIEKYFNYFKEPLLVAVIAPEKTTAVVPFDRIYKHLNKKLLIEGGDTKQNKKTVRGDEVKLYGIYDEYKGSTIEGNTFHLVIRDEAHKGSDKKFVDEVEPAMGAKIGALVMVGNGGWKDCEYKKAIDRGDSVYTDEYGTHETVLIKYTYNEAKPYLQALSDDGIEMARVRLMKVEKTIRKHGIESLHIRKNYFCEWLLEYGTVLTQEQLNRCHDETIRWKVDKKNKKNNYLYMGLDFATWHDRSIATIMNEKKHIIDWLVVKDDNERCEPREQCQRLSDMCDERGYTEHLIAIGFDATGVGSGGINEFLEEEFMCDLVPYIFSGKMKHEWYTKAIESVATNYDWDRIKFNPNHECASIFQKEWVELEQRELETQKYKAYSAPKKVGHYDDYVASFAIVIDLLSKETSVYKNLRPYSSRYESVYKPEDSSAKDALLGYISK